ncbi:BC1872 family protein [Paenibacillus gorillae]|uniref:BC1872 family protein n=1 Tax=Paenibacillus gorillae TaxID=1243662 RepID=UPI0005A7B89F|nr:hypothetical protein [Paenibacillus gorillae]
MDNHLEEAMYGIVGTTDCHKVGIWGGCGLDCWVYLERRCPEPVEILENKVETDEDRELHERLYGGGTGMNYTEIEKLQPGKELNELIAVKVLGLTLEEGRGIYAKTSHHLLRLVGLSEEEINKPNLVIRDVADLLQQREIPKYSTTWEGMRLVVDEMLKRGAEINIGFYEDWDCSIDYKGTNYRSVSEHAPYAVCKAALLMLNSEVSSSE